MNSFFLLTELSDYLSPALEKLPLKEPQHLEQLPG